MSHVWRLENKSVLSFYCVGPRNGAQVISYQVLPAHVCPYYMLFFKRHGLTR